MEAYGFVYLWYDRKHRRWYLGCRWGNESDGYICSSTWMKRAYKRRPQDFVRRIIARIYTDRKDLLKEEHRWLQMIKPEELGKRYYNLRNHHFGHWTTDENNRLIVTEKCSRSQKKRFSDPKERAKTSAATKKAMARPGAREKYLSAMASVDWTAMGVNISKSLLAYYTDNVVSEETRQKRAAAISKRWIVIHPDGKQEEVTNLKKFAREYGLCSRHLARVADGVRGHHKGFKCIRVVPVINVKGVAEVRRRKKSRRDHLPDNGTSK